MMIYCVEDDDAAANLEAYALESAGYETTVFGNSRDFFAALKDNQPELILLDIMLPGEDGISILKKLKANDEWKDLPVIMTTAKGTEFDKVTGLDTGADDYLVKPFGMLEMISRVKAVLRRYSKDDTGESSEILTQGAVELNEAAHTVSVNGEPLELTLKEYSLLELFMKNPERVFDRETLLNRIWDNEYYGDTRTVDVHIGTLRSKLGDAGSMIHTVRGLGYKLVKI